MVRDVIYERSLVTVIQTFRRFMFFSQTKKFEFFFFRFFVFLITKNNYSPKKFAGLCKCIFYLKKIVWINYLVINIHYNYIFIDMKDYIFVKSRWDGIQFYDKLLIKMMWLQRSINKNASWKCSDFSWEL